MKGWTGPGKDGWRDSNEFEVEIADTHPLTTNPPKNWSSSGCANAQGGEMKDVRKTSPKNFITSVRESAGSTRKER